MEIKKGKILQHMEVLYLCHTKDIMKESKEYQEHYYFQRNTDLYKYYESQKMIHY